MIICYLGLGSNLGDRIKNIRLAIEKINKLENTKVLKVSSLRKTKAVGGPRGQPDFVNAAVKIKTSLSASMLFNHLKKIEKIMGRVKTVRNGPRIIDIDILLYGDNVIKTKRLTIPHPRMFRRGFVVKPLAEVIC